MPQNQPDFESLIRAFNAEGVRYVIIGGLAMILQGSDYATVDTDFAVSTDPSNTEPIVRALAALRPHPHYATVDNFIWDERSIFGSAISMVTDAGDVDLLRVLPGVDSFEGLFERSEPRTVYGETVHVASLADLIAMKREANRPKDRSHLIELESLARLRREKPSPGA